MFGQCDFVVTSTHQLEGQIHHLLYPVIFPSLNSCYLLFILLHVRALYYQIYHSKYPFLPPSHRIWRKSSFLFLLEFSHHCFSAAMKQHCQHSVFCILGKSVLWGHRDEITTTCCWPLIGLFDGEGSGKCSRRDSEFSGQVLCFLLQG